MFTGIDHIGLFIAAGILLNLTPGPDVLYIVTHALKSGGRAGAVAALGITAGCFVHVAAAALGLSALMATSATAFLALKWLGAAYLVWVGWRMLDLHWPDRRAAAIPHATGTPPHPSTGTAPTENAILLPSVIPIDTPARAGNSLKNVFIRGFWTNVLNPKVALFFLAFLPQFIAPGAPHPTLSFLILGVIFNINSLWVGLGYAWIGGAASRRWMSLQSHLRTLERTAGALFIGFGLKLALTDNPPI
jgi:threonine/homoserine/homoserine lactone efflux protein